MPAACTGSSPTWTSTPDVVSITTCMGKATAGTTTVKGDTINVTSGTASWGNEGLQITKVGLQIIGGLGGTTTINSAGPHIYHADNVRVSGFTFNTPSSSNVTTIGAIVIEGSTNFRFDHNIINNADWSNPLGCIFIIGSNDSGTSFLPSFGLIDHNSATNCRHVVWGEWTDTGGSNRWAEHGNQLGTQYAVFIEDNTFTILPGASGPASTCDDEGRVLCNFVDTWSGGSLVARFNIVNNSYFEQHSTHGGRGTKNWEIYHNSMTVSSSFKPNFSRPFYLQGAGTGIIFENHADYNYSVSGISYEDERASAGICNGSNPADGNTDGFGYPCLDQIGLAYDPSLWNGVSGNPGQIKSPFYSWNNSGAGVTWGWIPNSVAVQNVVHANRDFYDQTLSFNGTVGVGVGTLIDRPATCTTGVGYWATDEGEWNRNHAGNDGQLYQCIATDTWALFYVPYPYPHPLQN